MPAKFWRKRQIYMNQEQHEFVNVTTWWGLTDEDWDYIEKNCGSIRSAIKTAEALLKEKNT